MEDIPGRPVFFVFLFVLKGNRGGGVDLGERGVGAGERPIGVKGGETAVGMSCMREN